MSSPVLNKHACMQCKDLHTGIRQTLYVKGSNNEDKSALEPKVGPSQAEAGVTVRQHSKPASIQNPTLEPAYTPIKGDEGTTEPAALPTLMIAPLCFSFSDGNSIRVICNDHWLPFAVEPCYANH